MTQTIATNPQTAAARGRGIVKSYGLGSTSVVALDHVDVDLGRGEFTAIMGPSGSGKSTLMHCLAGLDSVTSGSVRIGDIELHGLSDKKMTALRRDRIGFVFQSFNLVPTLTALENITLPMDIAGRQARPGVARHGDRRARAPRPARAPAQSSCPAASSSASPCARALASRPEIVFGDEPTGNLDSRSSGEVLRILRDSVDQLGQTVVIVTHDPRAAGYADRVLFLADGRIVDEMRSPDRRLGARPDEGAGVADDERDADALSLRNLRAHKMRLCSRWSRWCSGPRSSRARSCSPTR